MISDDLGTTGFIEKALKTLIDVSKQNIQMKTIRRKIVLPHVPIPAAIKNKARAGKQRSIHPPPNPKKLAKIKSASFNTFTSFKSF